VVHVECVCPWWLRHRKACQIFKNSCGWHDPHDKCDIYDKNMRKEKGIQELVL
jgi:hypothetical protein